MTEGKGLYRILVAFNATTPSYRALDYAVKLCTKLQKYKLTLVYLVALNPKETLPYLDHLEKSYNMEIQNNAAQEIEECVAYIDKNVGSKVQYEFTQVEGEGETGPVLHEYILKKHPELDLLVVGTRNKGGLERWVLGSVSDYCVHHIKCPVTVVKDETEIY